MTRPIASPTGRCASPQGGEVLAPGDGKDPVQFVDARDLAAFMVTLVEARAAGTYNATGPEERYEMAQLLDACKRVSGADAKFVWADKALLEAQKVGPWMDMPVWIPRGEEGSAMSETSSAAAIARGLTFRPVEDAVRDTLSWWNGLEDPKRKEKLRAGISREREAEVLKAWPAKNG